MNADVLAFMPKALSHLQDLTSAFLTQYEFDAFVFCSDDGGVIAAPLAMLMGKPLVDARNSTYASVEPFSRYMLVDTEEHDDLFRSTRAMLKREAGAECIGSLLSAHQIPTGDEPLSAIQLRTHWMGIEEDDYDIEGDGGWRYRRVIRPPALLRGISVFDESLTSREVHNMCSELGRQNGVNPCPYDMSSEWGCCDDNCVLCILAARDGRPENETREYYEAREQSRLVDTPESVQECHDYIFNGRLNESVYAVCDRYRNTLGNEGGYPCDGALDDDGMSMGFSCRGDACYLTCMMESGNSPERRLMLRQNPTADDRLITDVARLEEICTSCWYEPNPIPHNQRCCPPAGYGISEGDIGDPRRNSPYSIGCRTDNCMLALTAYYYGRGEERVDG